MRAFGIDCGTRCTGYGVVEADEDAPCLRPIASGGVVLSRKESLPQRLSRLFDELSALIECHKPDVIAVEEVFYSVNAGSALKLGHVRGVALLVAARFDLPVAEYSPLTIKSSVVGYGLANKDQVGYMVARLLHLDAPPDPADAADALAIAICHLHSAQTIALQTAVTHHASTKGKRLSSPHRGV